MAAEARQEQGKEKRRHGLKLEVGGGGILVVGAALGVAVLGGAFALHRAYTSHRRRNDNTKTGKRGAGVDDEREGESNGEESRGLRDVEEIFADATEKEKENIVAMISETGFDRNPTCGNSSTVLETEENRLEIDTLHYDDGDDEIKETANCIREYEEIPAIESRGNEVESSEFVFMKTKNQSEQIGEGLLRVAQHKNLAKTGDENEDVEASVVDSKEEVSESSGDVFDDSSACPTFVNSSFSLVQTAKMEEEENGDAGGVSLVESRKGDPGLAEDVFEKAEDWTGQSGDEMKVAHAEDLLEREEEEEDTQEQLLVESKEEDSEVSGYVFEKTVDRTKESEEEIKVVHAEELPRTVDCMVDDEEEEYREQSVEPEDEKTDSTADEHMESQGNLSEKGEQELKFAKDESVGGIESEKEEKEQSAEEMAVADNKELQENVAPMESKEEAQPFLDDIESTQNKTEESERELKFAHLGVSVNAKDEKVEVDSEKVEKEQSAQEMAVADDNKLQEKAASMESNEEAESFLHEIESAQNQTEQCGEELKATNVMVFSEEKHYNGEVEEQEEISPMESEEEETESSNEEEGERGEEGSDGTGSSSRECNTEAIWPSDLIEKDERLPVSDFEIKDKANEVMEEEEEESDLKDPKKEEVTKMRETLSMKIERESHYRSLTLLLMFLVLILALVSLHHEQLNHFMTKLYYQLCELYLPAANDREL